MISEGLADWIGNPEDLSRFSPSTGDPGRDAVDYLIVCDSAYVGLLEPLRAHHQSEGLESQIATVQEIVSSQPGVDDAERLRGYLQDRYGDGLRYALLAGDDRLVPVRFVYTDCEGWTDCAPAELYFSDLDGTWDADGDGAFGEPEDSVDFYSDIACGRALFSTPGECALFVDRTLQYLTAPPPGSWSETAVLCGAMLFEEIGYHAGKVSDSIAVALPSSWTVIKSYETAPSADGSDTHIAWIDAGTGWNHYGGHGTSTGVWWHTSPHGMMTNWIADTLSNGDRTGVHLSIACSPGAFHDSICCAEALMHNPDGGAVAVMFNTSYGWEGFWPEMGVSEWLSILTTRQVFVERAATLGDAFCAARDQRVPLMHGGCDRTYQVMMAWSLFGDPALRVRGVSPDLSLPPIPLTLGAPYPNPATRDAPVSFMVDFSQTTAPGPAEVSVLDLAGRLLWRSDIATRGIVQWDGDLPGGARVPAGVYLICARRGPYVTSRLVTILD